MATPVTLEAEPALPPVVESFADLCGKFPFTPSTDEGKGFLPILVRSMGHILYLVGNYAEKKKPTQKQAQEELEHGLKHWDNLVIDNSLSIKSKTEIELTDSIFRLAVSQIENWTEKESLDNLQILGNRMVQLMANLDREVLGLRGSDAGLNL